MTPTLPAWRRATTGERRWPVAVAVLVVAGLQLTLPDEVVIGSRWLLPVLEIAVLAVLLVATRFETEPVWRRTVSLALTALIGVANAVAAVLVQSAVSLATMALVVARAVNVLR